LCAFPKSLPSCNEIAVTKSVSVHRACGESAVLHRLPSPRDHDESGGRESELRAKGANVANSLPSPARDSSSLSTTTTQDACAELHTRHSTHVGYSFTPREALPSFERLPLLRRAFAHLFLFRGLLEHRSPFQPSTTEVSFGCRLSQVHRGSLCRCKVWQAASRRCRRPRRWSLLRELSCFRVQLSCTNLLITGILRSWSDQQRPHA
jgi:hypothetical protein